MNFNGLLPHGHRLCAQESRDKAGPSTDSAVKNFSDSRFLLARLRFNSVWVRLLCVAVAFRYM